MLIRVFFCVVCVVSIFISVQMVRGGAPGDQGGLVFGVILTAASVWATVGLLRARIIAEQSGLSYRWYRTRRLGWPLISMFEVSHPAGGGSFVVARLNSGRTHWLIGTSVGMGATEAELRAKALRSWLKVAPAH
jgi:hypothetical protein